MIEPIYLILSGLLIVSNFATYILLKRDFGAQREELKEFYENQKAFAVEMFDKTYKNLQTENLDLRDRLYLKQNLPPTGTDIQKEREEIREQQREKRANQSGIQIPKGTGLLAQAQNQAVLEDAKRNGIALNK